MTGQCIHKASGPTASPYNVVPEVAPGMCPPLRGRLVKGSGKDSLSGRDTWY